MAKDFPMATGKELTAMFASFEWILDYHKLAKIVSKIVILPLEAIKAFSNIAIRFFNMAMA